MGWIYSHKRFGAWPALAALALQIVISFGHVHLEGLRRDGGLRAGTPFVASRIAGQHKAASAQAPNPLPTQNTGDEDYCAICASIYLVASSFVPAPPPLPVPLGFERIVHFFTLDRGIVAPPRVAFRSRAPPTA